MHSDGPAQLAAATLHLVSAKLTSPNQTSWSADKAYSIMVDSVSKVKHHSVPILETIGMLEGTLLTLSYLAPNPPVPQHWLRLYEHFVQPQTCKNSEKCLN